MRRTDGRVAGIKGLFQHQMPIAGVEDQFPASRGGLAPSGESKPSFCFIKNI